MALGGLSSNMCQMDLSDWIRSGLNPCKALSLFEVLLFLHRVGCCRGFLEILSQHPEIPIQILTSVTRKSKTMVKLMSRFDKGRSVWYWRTVYFEVLFQWTSISLLGNASSLKFMPEQLLKCWFDSVRVAFHAGKNGSNSRTFNANTALFSGWR